MHSDMLEDLIPKYGRVCSRMSLAVHMQDICDAPDHSPASLYDDERKLEEARDEESQASIGHDEEEDEGPPKGLDILSPVEWQRLIKRVERLRRDVLRMDANDWVDESYDEDERPSTQYKNPPENGALNGELARRSAFSTKYNDLVWRYKTQRALSFIRCKVRNLDSEKVAAEAEVAGGTSAVADPAALSSVAQYKDFVESTFNVKPRIKERLLSVLLPIELDSPAQGTTPQALKLKPSNEVEKIISADYLSLRGFKRAVAKTLRKWEELALSESELVASGFGGTMLPPKGDNTAAAAATASVSSSFGVADSPSKNYSSSGTRSKRRNVRKNRSGGSTHSDTNEEEDDDEEASQSQALLTQPSSQHYRSENEPEQNSAGYRTKGVSRYQLQSLQQLSRDNSTSNEGGSGLESATIEASKVTATEAESVAGGEDSGAAQNTGTKRRRRVRHGRRTNSSGNRESYQHSGSRASVRPASRNTCNSGLSSSSIPSPNEAVQNRGANVCALAANAASSSSRAGATKERSARTLDFTDSESDSPGSNIQSPQQIVANRVSIGSINKEGNPRKKRRMWTDEEKDAIKKGVVRFGVGRWADMKSYYSIELANRTSVQIKDCYRTMKKLGQL